eukprot:CAMPEP_0206521520 /NCGR_PEP_ID=MMETSP0324_2-20121206/66380_1 /ASSEMBLY_ACC=CAM_ASM_000836 /TAXON_ID=2866 /ORGANISM="Crypthecodinium cohnii, Strain Seligo" /LENGTH=60 /DNA_ID=CAMNT_0054015397 /DNA_START=811 /DNA_END=993 /DNA_ORIENTATION=+
MGAAQTRIKDVERPIMAMAGLQPNVIKAHDVILGRTMLPSVAPQVASPTHRGRRSIGSSA